MNDLHSKVVKATKKGLKVAKNAWVSGTSVSNYLLKDPVIDWLKTYYNTYGLNNTRITRSKVKKINNNSNSISTTNVLMKNGCHFEEKIYEDLIRKFGGDTVVNLNATHNFTEQEKSLAFTRTLAEMKKMTPIIIQAYIKSDKLKLEGVTDILIRSDYLHRLVREKNFNVDTTAEHYYVVVDVKWSHMTLCVDGKTIRNEGRFKAYKGQLLIYNIILGEIQGYTPTVAYVMSKSWNIDKKGGEREGQSCYDLLGIIDYSGKDSAYVDQTMNAINWVRDVRTNGHGWSPLTPHIKELCCNSCNQDDKWDGVKKTIMNQTHDITQVWMLTPEHRNELFDAGITRWDDVRCKSELLNLGDGSKRHTVNEILEINQDTSMKIKLNIVDNRFGWQTPSDTIKDFYIDYETISEAFIESADMDINKGKLVGGYIFMIGVGYEDENGEFVYTSFVCNERTPAEERRIIVELRDFLNEHTSRYSRSRLFHWGHVEKTLMDSALIRHSSLTNPFVWLGYDNLQWVDMCSVFTKAPIVVRGALTFKLKDITKAMVALDLITTSWEIGELENGLTAMHRSIEYYSTGNKQIISGIERYNMTDCKVIWDIVRYLRNLL